MHMCEGETGSAPTARTSTSTNVVGKVFVLLWPRDRFGFLHRPDTFEDVPDAS